MHRAAILAYDGCYLSILAGYADLLHVANAHLSMYQASQEQRFSWTFVSLTGGLITTSNGLQVQTQQINMTDKFDIVFIPSAFYAGSKAFKRLLCKQAKFCFWLKHQWGSGAYLVSSCTGTFILAETGLLDGKPATTTWWLADQFRTRYPKVHLQLDPVITEHDRLICAGASASYLLQAVQIVASFVGATVASQCAKTLLIDTNQTKQPPYIPFLADRVHADSLVHKAQHFLQKNFRNDIKMSTLSSDLGVSERTLIRRFQHALEQSPLGYLQGIRIAAAQGLLKDGDLNVEAIAALVGYTDTSSFCRLFKQKVGVSPGAYRNQVRSLPALPKSSFLH
ncbi:GlxA family transcriptional regulator [Pseudomonas palleroniana]|uniref:GlxA family transcriptional regulator n=1 Tax=Pseudomonas palleroniana TaxID=191390 RepID=UPI0018E6876B|nr:helix-turn-helix domain-containing protein [Pseudomonas palleroniana]MBI6906817.1 helix-turn-helix domain-containing protein [Pseudomonas palleroniana]